uniref:Uncharacterized protein n=1 Tax=Triticum urartu TaxID=4572 RepID=A0A8R7PMX9_TRIUA
MLLTEGKLAACTSLWHSSSPAMARSLAILVIIFICCSVPCSMAKQVHLDGSRPSFGPPSPQGANSHGCVIKCNNGRPDTTSPTTAALTPHRKTLQQAILD